MMAHRLAASAPRISSRNFRFQLYLCADHTPAALSRQAHIARAVELQSRLAWPFCPRSNSGKRVAAYIALRYTENMAAEITTADDRALAALRYLIRKFVGEGDARARAPDLAA